MDWGSSFPQRLLSGACPHFPEPGLTRAEVEAAILRHEQEFDEEEIDADDYWRPDEVVLKVGRILVLCHTDPLGREERFHLVDLRSDNGKSFTAGQLYYKLYGEVGAEVRASYHNWFEGLELVTTFTTGAGQVPLYRIWLGN